ncbi:YdcF family protein [Haematospirillum jordaniae]|uniref:YdcF family protein n=1 Tax=Haematospirillum jordaniae TaxID=1549855 RepID=UPI0009ECFDC6|nr:YdcF family protein [Haematospirillum jordaniae]NKD45071.1 YdcF family protein [Haematospirillum jordaniae]NKD57110.1 YdcF family protein [Haematospirillum jordaniae]NKD59343.1 YdcF family protein [Haematospirillum jordaniae]NKD67036.1 YdcF family protein [Haematospirillum jordaniae]NKD79377.1 YdcF family protein [Haematospirillum jordaniae]
MVLTRFLLRLCASLTITGLAFLALWLPGLVWFTATMPEQVEDSSTRTDAIVVLTGGSERMQTGFRLLEQGMGSVLFISGAGPGTTPGELLRDSGTLKPEALRNHIELGHIAADTVGNAWETTIWLRSHGLTSMRLVTGSYHMRRSLLEFQAAMPEATIIPHPVFPGLVKQDNWWQYPGTAALFATEYTKYLLARLRLSLPDAPGIPKPVTGIPVAKLHMFQKDGANPQ